MILEKVYLETKTNLQLKGWCIIEKLEESDFILLSKMFGEPVIEDYSGNIIEELRIKEEDTNNKGSWANIYQAGEYPFHTDMAYYKIPPKFLFLRLKQGCTSNRKTVLFDIQSQNINTQEQTYLGEDIWKINNYSTIFTTKILSHLNSKEYVYRYDPVCMSPFFSNSKSKIILESLFENGIKKEISWTEKQVLLINNWRVFHSRDKGSSLVESNRILQRILIR